MFMHVAFGEQVDAHAQERYDKAHASTDGDPDSDEEGSTNDDGKAADPESVNGWESDDEGSPPEDSKPPPRPISRSKDDLKAEFKACFKRHRQRCGRWDWSKEAPNLKIKANKKGAISQEDIVALWYLPMGPIFKRLIEEDQDGSQFGHLPVMATASKASIAALLASSFCERINSAANIVLHDGNLKMGDDEINKLTVKGFMKCMRKTYPGVTLADLKDHHSTK